MEPKLCQIPDGAVKKWFEKNRHVGFLDDLGYSFEPKGYKFDPRNGFFMKPDCLDDDLQTALYIVITRDTNLHYHTDVTEFVRSVSGDASLYMFGDKHNVGEKAIGNKSAHLSPREIAPLSHGHWMAIQQGELHGIRPDIDTGYVELKLLCDGLLKDENEVEVRAVGEW